MTFVILPPEEKSITGKDYPNIFGLQKFIVVYYGLLMGVKRGASI